MKGFTPLILIGITVGLFFFFIDPQYQKIKLLQAEIDDNQELIELANDLRRERVQLQEKYNQISPEEREKIQKILPDTIDNVRLILDISNIADEFGISITNIGITGEQNEQNEQVDVVDNSGNLYGTIGLSFSVSSRYDVFKDFMQALESSLRLVDIESFNVSAGEGVFYDFDVSLNTYWLR